MTTARTFRSSSQLQRAIIVALLLGFLGTLAPALAGPVAAADSMSLAVDTVADDPGATACTDAAADCSLRGALINANADGNTEIETIVVPAGNYELTVAGGDELTGSLNVSSSMSIVGAGPASTIVDANGLDRVLTLIGGGPVAERVLDVRGMTVRGGRPCAEPGGDDGNNGGGGGLFLFGVATLTDVIVEDNATTCGRGGGIESTGIGSSLTLLRTVVRANSSLQGGAGISSTTSLTMVDSTVSGNVTGGSPGGGLRLEGTAVIDRSTISGNVGTGRGGGIDTGNDVTSACCLATVTITNSTISNNVARYSTSGTPQYFPGTAGGIFIGRSAFTLRHVTVTANVSETHPMTGAQGVSGGIGSGYTSFLTLDSSIVAGNTGRQDCLYGPDLTYSSSGSIGCSTAASTPVDLGPLGSNGGPTLTHAVAAGSTALDAAPAASCLPVDQRGQPRPSGDGCDIGAFELQIAPPPPPPAGPADAIVVVTAAYDRLSLTEDLHDFRFDVSRAGTSLAAFDGSDLFGPAGPIDHVVGVDVLDPLHGDTITVSEAVPDGWLAVYGGDCAANGSLSLVKAGQVRTCTVTNVHLDESQPASVAGVVFETSFRTPPTVSLRDFDVRLFTSETLFEFDAQDLGQAGRRTLGIAVPDGEAFQVGVETHSPAGWLAIRGADCANGSPIVFEPGKLSRCTIEWFEVDPAADAIVVVTAAYDRLSLTGDLHDFRFDVSRAGTSLAAFDGSDLFGPAGPIDHVVGVDVLDPLHGDTITVSEAVPDGWLAVYGGDCAANGSLSLVKAGQVRTCTVTNVHLDESQPASVAGVVFETSFRTPPTVSLRDFDVRLFTSETLFEFDAQDLGQAGRRTLGIAVPDGEAFQVGVETHSPAGWLAIRGADCANGSPIVFEPGKLSRCTIEWFEVDPAADAIVVVTAAYDRLSLTGDLHDFRFDVSRAGTSLAAFDGSDLFGPAGPIDHVVGVDVLDPLHGDTITVSEAVPDGWLAVYGGDCAANGSLSLVKAGQVRTCTVTNVHLDESQPASVAGVVFETSFRTPPTVSLRDFDVRLFTSETLFAFDAQDLGQAGRRTLGIAVPDGEAFQVGVETHSPAGWLAIRGADCANGSPIVFEPGKLSRCTIEWFEVGVPEEPAADLVISDCSAAALATVTAVTGNVVVTDPTCAELSLPNLGTIAGDLIVADNATLTELSLPNLGRISGDLVITGNDSLLDIDLSSLTFVGGNLTVTQNTAVDALATAATAIGGDMDVSQNATLTVISMPDVETVGGDMALTENPTLTTIAMPAVENVGGDFDISGNATLTDVSAPTLTVIGGDVDVSSNASMTMVSAPSVTTIGGDLDVSGNASLTTIEMPTVTTIGGDVDVSQNATIADGPSLVLHLPALISVGGSMTISENVQLASVDAPAVTTVGGDMDISGNATLTTIEAPEIETVGGDMTLTGNPSLTVFEAPSLETVEGDLALEIQAATIELATVNVAGSSTVVGTDTDRLTAATALGATSFQLINGLAALDATLPDGTFDTNVAYAIDRLGGSDLDPAGLIDPLAAYHLDFDVPTLGVDAAITFTIDLDEMSSAERQSFLDALAAGRATLAVRTDGGATYEAIDVCAAGQTPAVDGCVAVRTDGSTVTFDGVAGHFSTWAVVVVASPDVEAPVVTVPDDKRLEATGSTGRTVAFASEVAALDDRDGAVATECAPASGSTFPLGTTTVTCRAVDAAGNEGSATFQVTIVDSTAPAITVPATIVVTATAASGATVTYSASASDLVSGVVDVSCTPLSGTTFAVGQTTVTCGATDGAGNAGTGTFVVRVLGPVDLLTGLRNDVSASVPNVAPKLAADLAGKLDDAVAKLGQQKTADACKKVQEFMAKVTDESAKRKIPAALATDWLDRARQVRTLLGC